MAFRVVDMQQCLRAKSLPVTGVNGDLVRRFMDEGDALSEKRATRCPRNMRRRSNDDAWMPRRVGQSQQ